MHITHELNGAVSCCVFAQAERGKTTEVEKLSHILHDLNSCKIREAWAKCRSQNQVVFRPNSVRFWPYNI